MEGVGEPENIYNMSGFWERMQAVDEDMQATRAIVLHLAQVEDGVKSSLFVTGSGLCGRVRI